MIHIVNLIRFKNGVYILVEVSFYIAMIGCRLSRERILTFPSIAESSNRPPFCDNIQVISRKIQEFSFPNRLKYSSSSSGFTLHVLLR